jgi:hypothetical protein
LKAFIADLFDPYLNDIKQDISRVSIDWNDIRSNEALASALICSFSTYIKRFNLPIKQIGKFEIEKIPSFVNKKSKIKKNTSITIRGHTFVDCTVSSSHIVCGKCNLSFWGIGYQGLICQSMLN